MKDNRDAFDVDLVTLKKVTVSQASIQNPDELTSAPKGVGFEVGFNLQPGLNIDAEKIRIVFQCNLQSYKVANEEEKLPLGASFEIAFVFHIDKLKALVKTEKGGAITVPAELVASLTNIVYSTSRGIIYTRCLGTPLGTVILPVMSTSKLMGDQILDKRFAVDILDSIP